MFPTSTEPLLYAGHFLSALMRFRPELGLLLPKASQLFHKWQRCYVPTRAVPASWELVEGLVGIALHRGLDQLAAGFGIQLPAKDK